VRARTFSASWTVDDAVLEETHRRLLTWAGAEFGDLDQPVEGFAEFMVFVSWWDQPAA
jgi:hypothetical protein